jgi:chromate transporter
VTCLLAAGFEVVQHYPVVHAILRGVIPATAGIMGVVGVNFAQPLIRQARKEGWQSLSISSAIMLLSALALILFKLSVITVLVGVALLGVVIFTPWRPSATHPVPGQAPEDQSV